MCLGAQLDRIPESEELLFLPENLKKSLIGAWIKGDLKKNQLLRRKIT